MSKDLPNKKISRGNKTTTMKRAKKSIKGTVTKSGDTEKIQGEQDPKMESAVTRSETVEPIDVEVLPVDVGDESNTKIIKVSKSPITDTENRKRFVELDKTVRKNLTKFMEVAEALYEIKKNKLYKYQESPCHTFQEYCEERLEMSRQHASRLVTAHRVNMNISPVLSELSLPPFTSEYPLRRLKVVKEKEKLVELLKSATEENPEGNSINLKELYRKLNAEFPPKKRKSKSGNNQDGNITQGLSPAEIYEVEKSDDSKFIKRGNLKLLKEHIENGDTHAAILMLESMLED